MFVYLSDKDLFILLYMNMFVNMHKYVHIYMSLCVSIYVYVMHVCKYLNITYVCIYIYTRIHLL